MRARGDGSLIVRVLGGALGIVRVAVVLVVAGCLAAAEGGDPATPPPTLGERLTRLVLALHAYPHWTGPVVAALGLIPLFYGWQLIRWTMAICAAAMTGGAVLAFAMPAWDPTLAWTMAVSMAIIAGLLGYFLFQALVAVQGALIAFVLAALIVGVIAPNAQTVSLVLALLAAAVGFLLGWRLAPYLGIVESVLYAYLMILAGMIVLCRPDPGSEAWLLALAVGLVTVVPGMFVQLRAHFGREL